jgi:hypothetical protein
MNTATGRPAWRAGRPVDQAAGVLLTVTVSKPAIRALAGLVPCALSGASTFVRRWPAIAEMRGRHHQRRQLAVGPGRRLQRHGRQARSRPASAAVRTAVAAGPAASLRLIRMQVGQARQGCQPLVPLGVVLHRARAQRVEVRIDRHVQRRQVREVPHDIRLGQLRQRRRSVRQQLGGSSSLRAAAARRRPATAPRGGPAWTTRTANSIGCCASSV